MKLEYSPRARGDLLSIFVYLHARNPNAAINTLREIRRRTRGLADSPLMGTRTDIPDVRCLSLKRPPYRVHYTVQGDTISVVPIRHTSRRPWRGED